MEKSYTQEYGLDYHENFSPIMKPVTIRTMFPIAVSCGWHFRQLDVSNAFLNGELEEMIFMV